MRPPKTHKPDDHTAEYQAGIRQVNELLAMPFDRAYQKLMSRHVWNTFENLAFQRYLLTLARAAPALPDYVHDGLS